MKRAVLFAIPLFLANGAAFAAGSSGNAALALAALIGAQSPQVSAAAKTVLAHFLAAQENFAVPANAAQITVKADKITCRLGDVNILTHACVLTFGSKTKTLSGRAGQELLATMMENGVQADGAAGTIYYSVAPLVCTVDARAVQANDGGGAKCTYTNGE